MLTSEQETGGQPPYTFAYTYNRASGLTSQTYPSGLQVTLGYDDAGRIEGASSSGTNYASSLSYAPHGAVASLLLGSGVTESTDFNSLLQPTKIQAGTLLTLDFTYGSINNGNVISQTITRGGTAIGTQSYSYDGVNRLDLASEGATWTRDYSYDAFGNRSLAGSSLNFSSTNNRITAGGYDAAGNLTALANFADQMLYDANNKMTSFSDSSGGLVRTGGYAYDGQGNRVLRTSRVGAGAEETTTYVYDAFGKLAAEYSSEAPTGAAGTFYRTTDHLGSTRLVADAAGVACEARDFYPFGERIGSSVGNRGSVAAYATSCGFSQQFTAKERDDESGLDYFGARYFGASLGRFTSPDPLLDSADPSNPQTWNRYAYVNNRPLVLIDPTGLQSQEAVDCAMSSDCTLEVPVTVFVSENPTPEQQKFTTDLLAGLQEDLRPPTSSSTSNSRRRRSRI